MGKNLTKKKLEFGKKSIIGRDSISIERGKHDKGTLQPQKLHLLSECAYFFVSVFCFLHIVYLMIWEKEVSR